MDREGCTADLILPRAARLGETESRSLRDVDDSDSARGRRLSRFPSDHDASPVRRRGGARTLPKARPSAERVSADPLSIAPAASHFSPARSSDPRSGTRSSLPPLALRLALLRISLGSDGCRSFQTLRLAKLARRCSRETRPSTAEGIKARYLRNFSRIASGLMTATQGTLALGRRCAAAWRSDECLRRRSTKSGLQLAMQDLLLLVGENAGCGGNASLGLRLVTAAAERRPTHQRCFSWAGGSA